MNSENVFGISRNQEAQDWFNDLPDNHQHALIEWYNTDPNSLDEDDLTVLFEEDIQFDTCEECGVVEVAEHAIHNWDAFQGTGKSHYIHEWIEGHLAHGIPPPARLLCQGCQQ